ncbi:MAG: phosphatase PAP2 family protein, partial [Treponema sp.]|nr:phosphatase PAP2 family protein [Candidatus Treponema equi]
KAAACVYRPWVLNSDIHLAPVAVSTATGYSFPSGHSTLAANFFTSLAIWPEKSSRKLTIFCITATILAAFARNWVGAHSPMDVLIGISTGIIIAFAALNFPTLIGRHKNSDILSAATVLVISAAALIWLCLKSWPMDYNPDGTLVVDPVQMSEDAFKAIGVITGCAAGLFVEKRFIGFTTDIPLKKKILRNVAAVPVIVVALILFSFAEKAMGPRWGNFAVKAVLMFLATGGIPFLFKLKTFN